MKKKFALYLLGILLAFSLTACAGKNEAPSEADAESAPEETVTEEIPEEAAEDTANADDSTAEEEEPEEEELEIIDCVPEGPSDANFGPDNIGFYMEGEEFTLPMPYSEFLAKAESLGYSVDEDSIYLTTAENVPNCKYGKITFERPVENQENPETFDIKVINSVDYSKEIDLTDPDVHVVTFYMHMFASSSWEEENPWHSFNTDSQLYLTKEIGMGRNILNAYVAWGECSWGDGTDNSAMKYSNVLYTNGTYDASWYQSGITPDRFIWLKSDDDYALAGVFEEKYQKKYDYPITTILLSNNIYIQ